MTGSNLVTCKSSSSRLTTHPIPIAIQMRAIAGIAAPHRRSARGAGFAAVREYACAARCARGLRAPRRGVVIWAQIVGERKFARWGYAPAMAVIAAAFAVVVAAFGVQSAAVGIKVGRHR